MDKPHITRARSGGWKCSGRHVICYGDTVLDAWRGWLEASA